MRYAGLLIGLFMFMGCAMIWNKRDATHKDFKIDSYACHQAQYGTAEQAPVFDRDLYIRCMSGRGWRLLS